MTGSGSSSTRGFDELPPSCKCVYLALDTAEDEWRTRSSLLADTRLPERTLDDAIATLENRDYLLKARKSDDPSQVVCKLRESRRV